MSKNIYVGYCLAENNPGDPTILTNHSGNGIVIGRVSKALIEYCEARYNGWDMPRKGNGPVGIWTWHADQVIIQFCVSHHNRSTGVDGGGFDFDGGVTNSILQYNYSHDNHGSGYLICQYDGAAPFRGQHRPLQHQPGRRADQPQRRYLRLGRRREHGEHRLSTTTRSSTAKEQRSASGWTSATPTSFLK